MTPARSSPPPIRVLFVCTHNSARSQMAEALLARAGGTTFEVHSAGTVASRIDPDTIRVLAARGIDWTGARSKAISEFADQSFDEVITVCDQARDHCPNIPVAGHTTHWSLGDPALVSGGPSERLAAFERTADAITARLEPFMADAMARHRSRGRVDGTA